MKVLHINTTEREGGAARAAYRIHEALLKQGVDSYYYSLNIGYGGKKILHGKPRKLLGKFFWKVNNSLVKYIDWGIIKFFFRNIDNVPVSVGVSSMINRQFIDKINPDVINLHWICGSFVSIRDIEWLSKYSLVWTLHDSWPFTVACHVPQDCYEWKTGCRNCKLIKKIGIDLSALFFNYKKYCYEKSNFKIVGASKWISNCARQSKMFIDKSIICIHNTLNQDVYKPNDKVVARKILGIPLEKRIILFGAMDAISDKNKGFDLLYKAIWCVSLKKMVTNFELMVFGSENPDNPLNFGVPVHYLGRFSDDLSLSIVYSAADVMVVPSRSENFPNTVLESISCGTPVVAFRVGGIPEQIDHEINGYLAEPYDSYDLAKGVAYILEDENRWQQISRAAHVKAIECFNEKNIAQEYLKVYRMISNNH